VLLETDDGGAAAVPGLAARLGTALADGPEDLPSVRRS